VVRNLVFRSIEGRVTVFMFAGGGANNPTLLGGAP
jgi:hypothetical protein